jgi:hypothetical protein
MRYVLFGIAALVLLLGGVVAIVRLAPVNPAVWHVDPLTTANPSTATYARIGRGDLTGPNVPTLAEAAHRAMLAMPRTQLIAGSPDAGWMTYMTRSAVWGFPDFTSVRVIATAEGAYLVAFARSRFGASDHGVNAARLIQLYNQVTLQRRAP